MSFRQQHLAKIRPEKRNMTLVCALVGCGVRGSYWAQVLSEHPEVHLAALVDPDTARAQELANHLDGSVTCLDVLAPAPGQWDAVVLATPPELHFEQVQLCLEQGMHVICEKPLVEEFGQAIELVRMAEEADRLLMVGMNFRYLTSSQYLRRAVKEERFGPLGFGRFDYTRQRDGHRADLNTYCLSMRHPMLLEQSVHHLDLLRYCYGEDIVRLCADSWNPPGSVYRHDSCVSVLLEFVSGARVNYLGTWTAGWNGMAFSWRSDFQRGMILQRSQFGDVVECRFEPELGLTGSRFKEPSEAEILEPVSLPPQQPFFDDTRGLLDEFLGSIIRGTPLRTSAHDHLQTLAMLQACVDSGESRAWVDISDVFKGHNAADLWLAP